jgi:YgiT-type zinc finger domain-containing protein
MKCSIKGCTGEYEDRLIVHTVRQGNDVLVIENVPAEVCSVCGDTLLKPDTIQHIEMLLKQRVKPRKMAPMYQYA